MIAKNPDTQTSQTSQTKRWPGQVIARAGAEPIIWIGALAVVLRAFTLTKPFTGYFSLKDCISAMIARNWALGRTSLWVPMLDCVRDGQRSLHMVDFPCSTYLSSLGWHYLGGSLDVWGRALSIVWMLGAVVMLYYYVRRHHSQAAAAGAAFALAVSPVSIIFGQHFMLEPSLVFLAIGTIFSLDVGLTTGHRRWIVLAAVAFTLLILTKIYMVVLLLPIALAAGLVPALNRKKEYCDRVAVPSRGQAPPLKGFLITLFLFFLAMIPAGVWYAYAYHIGSPEHPLAKQMYYSVANSAESHRLPHPLWTSPKFYTHTMDDFATLVVTPVGFLLFWLGLLDREGRRHYAWLVASFLLIWLLPRKFYEMSYYYLVILPPVCILVGLGWGRLARGLALSRRAIFLTVLLAVMVSIRYAAGPLFVTDAEDRPVIAAAEAVRRLSRPEDRIIAVHATGIDLLYYCDRPGWTGQMRPDDWAAWVETCRTEGAKYLVVVETTSEPTPPVMDLPTGHTPPVDEGPGWKIFRLEY